MPFFRSVLVFAFLIVPVLAWPGTFAEVQVFDAFSGDRLARGELVPDQRLVFETDTGDRRYLALRDERFRGSDVLEISLADEEEVWSRAGYAPRSVPARNTFGRFRVETVPGGWSDRFCRAVRSARSGAGREASIELEVGGARYVSEPGWNGSGEVDLLAPAAPDREAEWQARIHSDGQLQVRQGRLGSWQAIGAVRDDFGMVRNARHSAGMLKVSHEPARYPQRFCQRYEQQGEAYQRSIVRHYFGRADSESASE
ncbi:hypothetical protein IC757_12800 [Wenzhouxiangella sp. AB-CW3]|uniref:hypothetical protein n=1 Tax=Wenzhouxiangella sp. AB-CW3 TaxID=2771012 RepID=UPI00168A5658|nr:hypothetical protein [Wenzhouxiangella sp. AB-CW3]QOC21900.1 hypothetical protein IC757_12800 [Wenzhouxiangella sp. AB-CW3]